MRTALLLVVTVPTLGMLLFSADAARARYDAAQATAHIEREMRHLDNLVKLAGALVNGAAATYGQIVADEYGLAPEIIAVALGGDDLQAMRLGSREQRDRLLGELEPLFDRPDDPLGLADLTAVLEEFEAELRPRVEAGVVRDPELLTFLDQLQDATVFTIGAQFTELERRVPEIAGQRKLSSLLSSLETLLHAQFTAVDELLQILGWLRQGDDDPDARQAVAIAQIQRLDAFTDVHGANDPELAAAWAEIAVHPRVRGLAEATTALVEGEGSPNVLGVALTVGHGFATLSMLDQFGQRLTQALLEEAAVSNAAAERTFAWSLALSVGLTLLSLVLALGAARAIGRPLNLLARRAGAIRDGVLVPQETPLDAVNEVAVVNDVLDEIVANLQVVAAQAAALSSGQLDAPELAERAPGALGASLRASVQRLSEVTGQLKASEALASAIVETAAEAIWTVDGHGIIRTANATAERSLGAPAALQVGRNFMTFVAEPTTADRPNLARELVSGSLRSIEGQLRHVDGRLVPVLLSTSRVEEGTRPLATVFAHNISDRKRLEARLRVQARSDPLTGLPNRAAAMELLEARRQRLGTDGVSVVFCDLDGFKVANDTIGHAAGDALLCEVAQRFRQTVREPVTLARLGGDEFVAIVPGGDPAPALAVADQLQASLRQPFRLGEQLVRLSASFGVATSWTADGQPLDLLRDADLAMYQAKNAGRARAVLFDEELRRLFWERAAMEAALRRALEEDALTLHYQPIVDLRTGRVETVEALLRWADTERGLVPPAAFIPVAEESGLIVELGRWVLGAAARQLAEWEAMGCSSDLRVAVNVAGAHLTHHDVVADLFEATSRAGVSPGRIAIEITETQLIDDLDDASQALRELRALGVATAIDDFGTGYSSITYLRQLPVRTIKIDRSFIADFEQPQEQAILASLTELASALGLETVAEGVESPAQLRTVNQLGCTHAQGYLVTRPLPPEGLIHWLAQVSHPVPAAATAGG